MVFGNTATSPVPVWRHGIRPTAPMNFGEFLVNAQGEDVSPRPNAGAVLKPRTSCPKAMRNCWVPPTLEKISRRAGHRVHHPGRQAVHAQTRNASAPPPPRSSSPATW